MSRSRYQEFEGRNFEPMKARYRNEISRNPSSEDKKVRRSNRRKKALLECVACSYQGESISSSCRVCGSLDTKIATQFEIDADKLNPGDHIRNGVGQVVTILRVRPHEANVGNLVYLDTNMGTILVNKREQFTVVPANAVQQVLPGTGTPGGNFNYLPFNKPMSSGFNGFHLGVSGSHITAVGQRAAALLNEGAISE